MELRGWASYCQVESLFDDRQLLRTARSWPSASSILVSRRERKALRHGSDSGLTAEMFRGWFSGLNMLKLILFQSKSNDNAQQHYLHPQNSKMQYRKWNCIRNLPTHYSIYYINHSKVVYITNHTTLTLGHWKFAVRYIPRLSPLARDISTANFL